MRRILAVVLALLPAAASAGGYTETAPAGLFLLESRLSLSTVRNHWTDDGELGALMEPVERYEPGGGLQGTIVPNAEAHYAVLVNLLTAGITDDVTLLVGVPVILQNSVLPRLGWIPGDYSPTLGRAYTEQDFWEWAASMGQPRPGAWEGNAGTLSDIVLGGRWRFSRFFEGFTRRGWSAAVTGFYALPTGRPPDPEELASTGTMSWNLQTQGEVGLHLGLDRSFEPEGLPLLAGVEVFHELFLPHTYASGTGSVHPLLMNVRPYVGDTYVIDPGDFTGAKVMVEVEAWRGPSKETWITRGNPAMAASLPPVLSLSLEYNLTLIGQSDWQSDSALWDWRQERFWKPGYKNILTATVAVSLFRLGVPLQLTGTWRSLTLLPGKNARAPDVLSVGAQLPLKFW